MLDTETKRRIDTCRDILVGKVPDPKSQVEQITVALIYKFMDDMDLQSEEFGGERKFFTKEFERYRWAKLVAPGVSGQDMLNTYSEALTKMVENERLPQLFRAIFRNAYLPYRDPETLRAFLREINSFTYDHSEKLGDAFEYLLSVLGSQGDAGQFRTPRHIIDFMVEIINPQKNEVILDPACGTAGFLISAYKHILKQNSTNVINGKASIEGGDAAEQALESPLRYPGDKLTPDDRLRLARNIKGYDISPDMVRLSLVNLYLHGFADPKVEEYDTLTSEDKWTEVADVILANPPFMSPKGGIKPHTRFQVQSKRSEVLFVDYMAEHLTPNGRAAIVVPEGIIFQSQSAYVALRKMLVDNHLAAVISLPAGVFNPYSGVKTSILILDRAVARASEHVAFFKIENDGFALGAQRKAVKGSQLAQVKTELGAWLQAARAGGGEGLENSLGSAVERARLAEGGDYNLSAERYTATETRAASWDYRAVADICIKVGESVLPEALQGPVEYIGLENIVSQLGKVTGQTTYADPSEIKSLKTVFVSGDILYGKLRPNLNKVWRADRDGICSTDIFALRADHEVVDPVFLTAMLRSSPFNEKVMEQLRGAQLPRVGWGDFSTIEIPLPPIEVQREIVAEVEGYQRVIDGARAVLDNYRPHIPIDPEWPLAPLEELCLIQRGKFSHRPRNEPRFYGGEYPFIQTGDVVKAGGGKVNFTQTLNEDGLAVSKLFKPPVVLVTIAANIGDTALLDYPACFPDSVVGLTPVEDVDAAYLELMMRTQKEHLDRIAPQAAQKNINIEILKTLSLPRPDIETQKAIVAEIEAEQALVNCNRDLIVRLEKKIEAAIARVWGESEGEEAA
ncbi:MAG: N-6 DNA methylase [Novosphingobium sp.]|uniref:N-6 DNA methylase n=1 Tax=Novosphingobium sp. TaxID=1874826 RepID=UPI0022C4B6CA|nr:N-6 DNA methylase [Novosphingobium sp.]MCZ8036355.1 N-6 DNA methylase [Novosphingobium sp.]